MLGFSGLSFFKIYLFIFSFGAVLFACVVLSIEIQSILILQEEIWVVIQSFHTVRKMIGMEKKT